MIHVLLAYNYKLRLLINENKPACQQAHLVGCTNLSAVETPFMEQAWKMGHKGQESVLVNGGLVAERFSRTLNKVSLRDYTLEIGELTHPSKISKSLQHFLIKESPCFRIFQGLV